jgi:hypothetical protein
MAQLNSLHLNEGTFRRIFNVQVGNWVPILNRDTCSVKTKGWTSLQDSNKLIREIDLME